MEQKENINRKSEVWIIVLSVVAAIVVFGAVVMLFLISS
jgi:hypothetical protein